MFTVAASTAGQFPIKIPGIPKVEKPKTTSTETSDRSSAASTPSSGKSSAANSASSRHVYENETRPSIPRVIQPRVFIKAAATNSYWKMPNASNVTSWLPEIDISFVFDDRTRIEAIAEWYNPDGSLWFKEEMSPGIGNFGLSLRSNETWKLMDTKSTNATGTFSVKVKNKATGTEMYSGKFKVNKFLASFNAGDKNKLGYYVDHDWLLPLGVVSFDSEDLTNGGDSIVFSSWLKGDPEYGELEAQLLFNGNVIAKRKATSGMSYEERAGKFAVPFYKESIVERWQFQFENVLLHNGNNYNIEDNREWYNSIHWIDKNPGQYIFKLFRNNTQIREFGFTVGQDGRIVRPAYSDAFTFRQHGVLVPAKVMGNTEKWNPASARSDLFYGNPIGGFSIQ